MPQHRIMSTETGSGFVLLGTFPESFLPHEHCAVIVDSDTMFVAGGTYDDQTVIADAYLFTKSKR